jgi:hypothetical protein
MCAAASEIRVPVTAIHVPQLAWWAWKAQGCSRCCWWHGGACRLRAAGVRRLLVTSELHALYRPVSECEPDKGKGSDVCVSAILPFERQCLTCRERRCRRRYGEVPTPLCCRALGVAAPIELACCRRVDAPPAAQAPNVNGSSRCAICTRR